MLYPLLSNFAVFDLSSDLENSKFPKGCVASLTLLWPRNFAVFDSSNIFQYHTQIALNFTDCLFLQPLKYSMVPSLGKMI